MPDNIFDDTLKSYEYEYLSQVLEEAYYRQQALLEKIMEQIKVDEAPKNVSKKDTKTTTKK